jgi:hypothetical protein
MSELSRLTQHLQILSASQTDSMADNRPDITLYTAQTPNGIKISIALEELGIVSCINTRSCQLLLISLSAVQGRKDRHGENGSERTMVP